MNIPTSLSPIIIIKNTETSNDTSKCFCIQAPIIALEKNIGKEKHIKMHFWYIFLPEKKYRLLISAYNTHICTYNTIVVCSKMSPRQKIDDCIFFLNLKL